MTIFEGEEMEFDLNVKDLLEFHYILDALYILFQLKLFNWTMKILHEK